MLRLAEDTSDPPSQKAAFVFFTKCVTSWGKPIVENSSDQEGLQGFDRFIYERIVPLVFGVASSPNFNLKDGQVMVVCGPYTFLLNKNSCYPGSPRNLPPSPSNHRNPRAGSIYILPLRFPSLTKLATRNRSGVCYKNAEHRYQNIPKVLYRTDSILTSSFIAVSSGN